MEDLEIFPQEDHNGGAGHSFDISEYVSGFIQIGAGYGPDCYGSVVLNVSNATRVRDWLTKWLETQEKKS